MAKKPPAKKLPPWLMPETALADDMDPGPPLPPRKPPVKKSIKKPIKKKPPLKGK